MPAGSDPALAQVIGKEMEGGWSMVLGRMTYEDLYVAWRVKQPTEPMAQSLTQTEKFVASRQPELELPWENSTRLQGDVAFAVERLKQSHDRTLIVFGSGELVRALLARGLVDSLLLMTHPVVLGKGRRLFDEAPLTRFTLAHGSVTSSGVVLATYHRKAD